MDATLDISVVVPLYNEEESLPDRFHSQFQLPSDDLLSQNHMFINP
jgi:hypothetical protein